MEINIIHADVLTVTVKGRLDTVTSPAFDATIAGENITEDKVVVDFTDVEYISSAGLRALLALKRRLDAENKSLTIKNINAVVREVFSVTGFINVLTIE
ncbi:MAG: STAS domain-containing protein [Clostridia bacterium]|nr:STAS domain-containing protein [Clostridia bacterium]